MASVDIKKKSDEDMGIMCCSDDMHYPYGTSLCFEDELLEQMQIFDSVEVDQIVEVKGFAKVTRKTQTTRSESGGGSEECKELALQMLKVEVTPGTPQAKAPSPSQMLYGE